MTTQRKPSRWSTVTRTVGNRTVGWHLLRYAVSIGILLLCWWGISELVEHVKGRAFLPNPVRAIHEMWRLGPTLFRNFWVSAWRLVMALVIAFTLGYPLGLLIGRERRLDQLISPMIYIVYPIPQVAFILPLFLIFGLGNPVKVAIVASALFFQILVSARGAAKLIEFEHVTSVRSAGEAILMRNCPSTNGSPGRPTTATSPTRNAWIS